MLDDLHQLNDHVEKTKEIAFGQIQVLMPLI